MEVNTWERGVWDRTEGGVILVISLGAGSSAQKEWGTRMAAEGLLEVISGEGGTVRMEGAEEAGILGFLGDGEGTIGVDGEGTIGVINVFCIVLLFCYITLDSNKDQAFQLLANCNFFLKYPKKCSKNYFLSLFLIKMLKFL